MQLILDWKEKVCKKMPQEVTITYEHDIFTLTTSDNITNHKKSKFHIFILLLISILILCAGILWYISPIGKHYTNI